MLTFEHFDAAQKSVAAINEELQLLAVFGEMTFKARCFIRETRRHGTVKFSLGDYMGTAACTVPTSCKVTYLVPKTQLGMDALAHLKLTYSAMEARKSTAAVAGPAAPSLNGTGPKKPKQTRK